MFVVQPISTMGCNNRRRIPIPLLAFSSGTEMLLVSSVFYLQPGIKDPSCLIPTSAIAVNPFPGKAAAEWSSVRAINHCVIVSFSKRSEASRSAIRSRQSRRMEASVENFVVTNKHGEKLFGVIEDAGSKKVVILCHGFRSSKDDSTILNLRSALTSHGISAVSFDFTGNGVSEGTFEYGNYRREADDLHSVIQYLTEKGYETSAILGHSKGGDVVLLYASLYHDVPAVINVSGRFDLEKGIVEWLGQDFLERVEKDGYLEVKDKAGNVQFWVMKESLMDRLNTDMRAACLLIDESCRVFTVHGTSDDIIPVGDAFEFDKIIPNHKLHTIEGADHGYTKHQGELASAVLDFLKSAQEP